MTRRARLAAGLVGLVGALVMLVTGCGVPTSTDVQYVRPGPAAGSTSPGDGNPPPHADEADTPRDQVDNFLQAAAGSAATAPDRVREYIRAEERDGWRPEEGIRVIRLLQEPFITDEVGGGWLVELSAQLVGELDPQGFLDPPTVTEPVTYQFRVTTEGSVEGEAGGQGLRLRVTDPPPYLLLQDTALANEDYYYPNPIYFWDTDGDQLVPDLRWLPLAGEPAEQHPWTVVQWLLTGPAPGLTRLESLPAGTNHIGTPYWEDDRLVVNFNAAAVDGQEVDDLATQLARSLLQLRGGDPELELRIEDRVQHARVRAQVPPADPTRFVLLDGAVRAYSSDRARQPAVLTDEVNFGVQAAALTAGGDLAALVRGAGEGQQRVTVLESSGDDAPRETDTGLVAGEFGQPVWVGAGDAATGLVAADGELHRFTVTGESTVVAISGLAGPITAVALAPEQRRLALVAGDQLYVAQLRVDAESVTVQAARRLPTTVTQLAGVAFTHENQLVVAGETDGRVGLHRLSADGAVEEPLHDLSNATVTALVAHPAADATAVPRLMYEANGQAYTFAGVPSLIRPVDLLDAPDEPDSPPRAPFFLG
ncbi:GerMN domain-containing protein [Natronosporangium hydrolyticum]|uniref:GerMN domain-containing protein n=1 Tax=Natronosporangium hydrolyticum TaxID=2811111 RepID=A0A895Y846_9ACTN|nr:hypothetical protein [Natronosporangium hydrolyticum]QSB13894.1 GerMN domain-containing protein [Natronosporangium hydrolyticum]